jgi:hypothetical protein
VSRPDVRRRKALRLLSRLMRPLPCSEIARRAKVEYAAMQNALQHPWFDNRNGVTWVTEAGWRERLAGYPDLRGE